MVKRAPLSGCAAVAVGAGVLLLPVVAGATNGATPRTPPVFKREQCLTVVDRSVDPVFHIDFAIPFEDDQTTPDELPDSRRFQFFAVCRDHHLGESLPNWITMDDAQRAVDQGLSEMLPADDDVLELAADWSVGHDDQAGTCALAVNAAEDRIPITCAATEGGVDWDTTGVAPGNYVVHGYNFEPALNLWVARRGVVQVVDGQTERYPVVSLMFPAREGDKVYEGDPYEVVGCMDGPPGTTVQLSWAAAIDLGVDEPGDWTPFAELDAAQGSFNVPFDPPPEAVQQAVVFRGVAQAPDGKVWIGYAPNAAVVYPGEGETDPPYKPAGPDYCGYYPDEPADTTTGGDSGSSTGDDSTSGSTTGGDTTTGGGGTTGTADTGAADGGGSSCSCGAGGDAPIRASRLAWLGLFALVAMRRRNKRM